MRATGDFAVALPDGLGCVPPGYFAAARFRIAIWPA
jgi:hypothetical protein